MKNGLIKIMLLILACVFALTGCGETPPPETPDDPPPVLPEEVTVEVSYCSSGGTVTFDKDTTALVKGDSLSVKFENEEGYYLDKVEINGKEVTDDLEVILRWEENQWGWRFYYAEGEKYDLKSIQENIDIKAWFKDELPSTITYVSPENAPRIDGVVDDIWSSAKAFRPKNAPYDILLHGFSESKFPSLKVLWSEDGLYFYGKVYDSTLRPMDTFNIWINETYIFAPSTDAGSIPYSNDATAGNYAININPYTENNHYTGVDIYEYWYAQSRPTADGYEIEVFIPVLSRDAFAEGDRIGLDISVDYFSYDPEKVTNPTIKDNRDGYVNWYGQGNYTSNIGALREMQLVKTGCGETPPPVLPEEVTVEVSYCSSGGTVTFDKDITALVKGDSLSVKFENEEGYYLDKVEINGKEVTDDLEVILRWEENPWDWRFYYTEGEKYDLKSIQENIDIKAWFKDELPSTITYVSPENAPRIDGVVDDIWSSVEAFRPKNAPYDILALGFSESKFPSLKVLWSEDGLYFYGKVYDSTLRPMDTFNIWINETYIFAPSTDAGSIPYSNDATAGNYAININPYTENNYYTGVDIYEYWYAQSRPTADGYEIEVFIPVLSRGAFAEGDRIGLDISVDYFSYNPAKVTNPTIKDNRDGYVNWYGQGWYWSNIGALREMQLVK